MRGERHYRGCVRWSAGGRAACDEVQSCWYSRVGTEGATVVRVTVIGYAACDEGWGRLRPCAARRGLPGGGIRTIRQKLGDACPLCPPTVRAPFPARVGCGLYSNALFMAAGRASPQKTRPEAARAPPGLVFPHVCTPRTPRSGVSAAYIMRYTDMPSMPIGTYTCEYIHHICAHKHACRPPPQ